MTTETDARTEPLFGLNLKTPLRGICCPWPLEASYTKVSSDGTKIKRIQQSIGHRSEGIHCIAPDLGHSSMTTETDGAVDRLQFKNSATQNLLSAAHLGRLHQSVLGWDQNAISPMSPDRGKHRGKMMRKLTLVETLRDRGRRGGATVFPGEEWRTVRGRASPAITNYSADFALLWAAKFFEWTEDCWLEWERKYNT